MAAQLAPAVEQLVDFGERRTSQSDARVWLEIDLGRIRDNYRAIRDHVAPLKVMAILKANAYGLGVKPIATCLRDAGIGHFGVAELREALAIVDLGVPVLILGGLIEKEIPAVVEAGLEAPIGDLRTARLLSAEAQRQGKTVKCHFVVDTGMGRLGILHDEAEETIAQAVTLPNLTAEGIYSHFPYAYGDYDFSVYQLQTFRNLIERLRARGVCFTWRHLANSDGINNIPTSYTTPFNLVRTGINLYGIFDAVGRQSLSLEPVLKLKARLVAARQLPAGATLGYGLTYQLTRPMRVGTVAIGYADGLPLSMSSRGVLSIRGRPCPILGRVSMDYTTVSLEAVPDAEPGDEVVCLEDNRGVAEWAHVKGTIPYEIICSFGNRVERRYLPPLR